MDVKCPLCHLFACQYHSITVNEKNVKEEVHQGSNGAGATDLMCHYVIINQLQDL